MNLIKNENNKLDEIKFPRKTTKNLIFENLIKIFKENNSSKTPNDISGNLDQIFSLSEKIEDSLYNNFDEEKEKYIRKTKSILANLKKNKNLFSSLIEENLSTNDLVKMEEKEMASDDLKLTRQKIEEDSFNSRRSDWNRIHNTFISGLYRCGKCRKSETTYYQAQIRRADEPMTTFVTCLNCNNNWKC